MYSNNEIMLMNDVVYKIHTMQDLDEMRLAVLHSLEFMIPSPLLTFYMADPNNPGYLTNPIGIAQGRTLDPNATGSQHSTTLDISLQRYLDEFQELDYTRWVFSAPFAKVYRETDFMSDEERIQTEYYQRMYLPDNIHYSIILTLNYQGTFLGCICLYRNKNSSDYSEKEMMILDMLKDHLSYRLALQRADIDLPTMNPRGDITANLLKEFDLTRREEEILQLLLDGTNKNEICDKLCIAPNTLKKHTMHIYKKTNVSSWKELFCLFKKD